MPSVATGRKGGANNCNTRVHIGPLRAAADGKEDHDYGCDTMIKLTVKIMMMIVTLILIVVVNKG